MTNVYITYDHTSREFKEVSDPKKYKSVTQGSPDDISNQLDGLGVDGLLIFNRDRNEWNLVFAKSMGIVAQRTARRQADTISRSGFLLSSGERVGPRCLLQQLTEDNIGDLNRTVQEKYVASDLGGFRGDSRSDKFPQKVFAVEKPTSAPRPQPAQVVEKKPEPTPKVEPEPKPDILEPKPAPEISAEPTPEPAVEPTPEPAVEPTPEPAVSKLEPPAKKEPESEPESEPEEEPTPDSTE